MTCAQFQICKLKICYTHVCVNAIECIHVLLVCIHGRSTAMHAPTYFFATITNGDSSTLYMRRHFL